jgi:hypothetical protein
MTPHYQSYMSTFNRVQLGMLIDDFALAARLSQSRASLIQNPLTGRCYSLRAAPEAAPAVVPTQNAA